MALSNFISGKKEIYVKTDDGLAIVELTTKPSGVMEVKILAPTERAREAIAKAIEKAIPGNFALEK